MESGSPSFDLWCGAVGYAVYGYLLGCPRHLLLARALIRSGVSTAGRPPPLLFAVCAAVGGQAAVVDTAASVPFPVSARAVRPGLDRPAMAWGIFVAASAGTLCPCARAVIEEMADAVIVLDDASAF